MAVTDVSFNLFKSMWFYSFTLKAHYKIKLEFKKNNNDTVVEIKLNKVKRIVDVPVQYTLECRKINQYDVGIEIWVTLFLKSVYATDYYKLI